MKQSRPFPTTINPNRGSQMFLRFWSRDGDQIMNELCVRVHLYRFEIAQLGIGKISHAHPVECTGLVVSSCRFNLDLCVVQI